MYVCNTSKTGSSKQSFSAASCTSGTQILRLTTQKPASWKAELNSCNTMRARSALQSLLHACSWLNSRGATSLTSGMAPCRVESMLASRPVPGASHAITLVPQSYGRPVRLAQVSPSPPHQPLQPERPLLSWGSEANGSGSGLLSASFATRAGSPPPASTPQEGQATCVGSSADNIGNGSNGDGYSNGHSQNNSNGHSSSSANGQRPVPGLVQHSQGSISPTRRRAKKQLHLKPAVVPAQPSPQRQSTPHQEQQPLAQSQQQGQHAQQPQQQGQQQPQQQVQHMMGPQQQVAWPPPLQPQQSRHMAGAQLQQHPHAGQRPGYAPYQPVQPVPNQGHGHWPQPPQPLQPQPARRGTALPPQAWPQTGYSPQQHQPTWPATHMGPNVPQSAPVPGAVPPPYHGAQQTNHIAAAATARHSPSTVAGMQPATAEHATGRHPDPHRSHGTSWSSSPVKAAAYRDTPSRARPLSLGGPASTVPLHQARAPLRNPNAVLPASALPPSRQSFRQRPPQVDRMAPAESDVSATTRATFLASQAQMFKANGIGADGAQDAAHPSSNGTGPEPPQPQQSQDSMWEHSHIATLSEPAVAHPLETAGSQMPAELPQNQGNGFEAVVPATSTEVLAKHIPEDVGLQREFLQGDGAFTHSHPDNITPSHAAQEGEVISGPPTTAPESPATAGGSGVEQSVAAPASANGTGTPSPDVAVPVTADGAMSPSPEPAAPAATPKRQSRAKKSVAQPASLVSGEAAVTPDVVVASSSVTPTKSRKKSAKKEPAPPASDTDLSIHALIHTGLPTLMKSLTGTTDTAVAGPLADGSPALEVPVANDRASPAPTAPASPESAAAFPAPTPSPAPSATPVQPVSLSGKASPVKRSASTAFVTDSQLNEAQARVADVRIIESDNVTEKQLAQLLSFMKELALQPRPSPLPGNYPETFDKTRYFACDTEVAHIDVRDETPVAHGVVNCFSIYCGPDVDFSTCTILPPPPAVKAPAPPPAPPPAFARFPPSPAPGLAGSAAPATTLDASSVAPATMSVHEETGISLEPEPVRMPRLWVDVWDEVEKVKDEHGNETSEVVWEQHEERRKVKLKPHHPIIAAFKEFFEDETIPKVWHNYGFDRHVLSNLGIECKGFRGDTLHMARLHDASRSGRKNYGLENLTNDLDIMRAIIPPSEDRRKLPAWVEAKTGMKELFGKPSRLKNGAEGKVLILEPVHLIHAREDPEAEDPLAQPLRRLKWIHYSALDAKATWQLREALAINLMTIRRGTSSMDRVWKLDPYLNKLFMRPEAPPQPALPPPASWQLTHQPLPRRRSARSIKPTESDLLPPVPKKTAGESEKTMWDLYVKLWIPFGELLTSLEARGMPVDREHLQQAETEAKIAVKKARATFMEWVESIDPQWKYINPSSGSQIRQLLYPEHIGVISRGPKKADPPPPPPSYDAMMMMQPGTFDYENMDMVPGDGRGSPGLSSPVPTPPASPKKKAPAKKQAEPLPKGCRVFKIVNPEYEAAKERGDKSVKKNMDVMLYSVWGKGEPGRLQPEGLTATGAAQISMRVLRILAGKVGKAKAALEALKLEQAAAAAESTPPAAPVVPPSILDDEMEVLAGLHNDAAGVEPEEAQDDDGLGGADGGSQDMGPPPAPAPATKEQMEVLEKEAKEKGFGKMYAAMGGGEAGLRACVALEALCEASAIEKLLSSFILPLQSDKISTRTANGQYRVHCSLNINTETGRLSARRPNMQNQPALEKDLYKIRKAFKAAEGNTLVVADYGQLELRLLAHMADCKSMLDAFEKGGDFHSRTALGMYDYIKEAIKNGEVYLETPPAGAPERPMLKDKFASERRKAKILNFSIAYGKTAHGLAKDFGTSLEEAKETVNRWYADRQEVKKWQEDIKQAARNMAMHQQLVPAVYTLLGRTRPLPDIMSDNWSKKGHAERAAINTPIQGAAADVASSAMVAIEQCPELKALGYKLLMQVHDEVILEGPQEHAQRAKELVQRHMANPWAAILAEDRAKAGLPPWDETVMPLRTMLATDCDAAPTWYEAK